MTGAAGRPRAIVIGGSLGGLLVANMLRQVCGWEVDLFERVDDDLASRGAGIATHDEMFDVLRRLGLPVDESFGIDVTRRICFGKSGDIIYEYPMRRKMSAWSRFYRPLKDHFPQDRYPFWMTLRDVEQHPDHVTAIFADGTRVNGDLLIGAMDCARRCAKRSCPGCSPPIAATSPGAAWSKSRSCRRRCTRAEDAEDAEEKIKI